MGLRSGAVSATAPAWSVPALSATALAWSARPDGTADFFNQHYLEFVGFSADEAKGWGWTAAVHPDDLSGLTAIWQQVLTAQQRGEAEARLLLK